MADEPIAPALMNALVTEHFVLQSAASTTVSEALGRATLYLSSLSSSLVAMGFAAQSPDIFPAFAAAVIPVLLLLGVLTVVRLVDTGIQNITYLAGIARIRARYRTLSPEAAQFFQSWGDAEDETGQALASLAVTRSPLVGLFTTASTIASINSVVAGAGIVLPLVRLFGIDLAVAVPVAVVLSTVLIAVFYRYQDRRYRATDRLRGPDRTPVVMRKGISR
ncbi:hypothetical protein IU459_27595 [Nocardia amamiensis]|uniref:ABC transmembrane type-1 domain-containing protein n=1 Tax=Nocardia amamiensis TaxID=404578 RepID=A0ABS0CZV3_9NOCA|nr:hypothetical protein [Nocardia amamiensis]MBF6301277.1 hypothetical protein [Nocardia amamiensis]